MVNAARSFRNLAGPFALFALAPLAGAQDGPAIYPAASYRGGSVDEFTVPRLAVGDLDGDGRLDAALAVSHAFTGGYVHVLRGTAQGGLRAPVTYGASAFPGAPTSVAIGDVSGDGRPDLVMTTSSFGQGSVVWVMKGNAQGTLDAPDEYPGTGVAAVGDVTGDGRSDVVLVQPTQACVLAGNAQGTLDPAVCYALSGNGFGSVAIGDLTGDGRPDVVAASSNRVCVLAGNAQGTLDPAACQVSGGSQPDRIAFGDVTGDTRLDVVLVDSTSTMVRVLAGNAGGTLDPAVTYAAELADARSIAVGDVSRDGRPDLVVAGRAPGSQEYGRVCVLRGNAGGTLDAAIPYEPGLVRPQGVAVADLAGDGRLEVLVASGTGNDLYVLESDGQGGLEVAMPSVTDAYGPVVLADFSGDGRPDVVQVNPSDQTVCLLTTNASGELDPPTCYTAGGALNFPIATGELTGDSFPDVVVSTISGVCVLAGNGLGTLDPPVCYPAAYGELAVGDVTGDGRDDVVVSTMAGVCVLAGNAGGTLDPPVCTAAPYGEIALGEVTGDTRLDVVVGHSPSGMPEVCVLAGNAGGGLDAPVCYPGAGGFGTIADLAVADMDGDGRGDVLALSYDLCVLHGNAAGTLDAASCLPAPPGTPQGLEVGDVNADGLPDVVIGHFTSDLDGAAGGVYVSVLAADGHGGFEEARSHASGASLPGWLALADLDGDLLPEAIVPGQIHPTAGTGVAVLRNRFPVLGVVSCTGTACPCGNDGAGGRGCQNSSSTGGARLYGDGEASLAEDTARLFAQGEKPSALTIFLQGDAAIAPVFFGDGLRCAGGILKRLYVKNASQGAVSAPGPTDLSISARSAVLNDPLTAGDMRVYQTYYRDPNLGFCPSPPGSTFNASNALVVTWGQ